MFKIVRNTMIIAASATMIFTSQSCTKKEVIELTPEFTFDALTNPSSMDQVNQVLLGAYAGFRGANYYGSGSGTGNSWGMMPDILSDNLYETLESLANSRRIADWTYDAGLLQIADTYNAPYIVIARANIVLRDVDKFTTPANQKLANRIKGQALAIRALAHFDLFRYFAENYDRNSTTVLAVNYVTEFIVSTEVKNPRISNKAFYDKFFADISQAITLLGDVDQAVNPSGTTRPFIDRNAAYAIQARGYLYAGLWAEAATAATNAIAGRPLVNLSQSAFSGMYNQTNLGEIIWNVQFDANQGGPTLLVFFATNQRSYFRPALEIATTAGTSGLIQNNDIRYSAFFTTISGGLAVTKYKGKSTASDANANFIPFRTGELYLIRAEARARNSQEGLALDDLNALRAARINGYTPVAGLTGTALLNAIADERRRELVAEGHRFFDLKRTSRTIVRGSTCGNQSISVAGDCQLDPTDREWAFPIPDNARRTNPNLEQNNGYN
jgi:starch-binding outer membrane protein, SusD/RagB family